MAVTVSETKTPGFSEKPGVSHTGGRADRIARKLVQLGFLGLFLYPLAPVIFRRITFQAAPIFLSWLLPWDPLLFLGHLLHRDWSLLVIGAPLLLAALTLVFGRAFCGWVCPIGTVLDLVRPLAFWQGRTARRSMTRSPRIARMNTEGEQFGSSVPVHVRLFPANVNSPLRYYLLIAVLAAGVLSLQAMGLLDPLVIFQRTATALMTNAFALQQRPLMVYLIAISLVFLGIVLLELWQPRFWCRNLCPLGALLSIFSRWSLLNRRVSESCTYCGECRRVCAMNAIPRKEPHDTDYTQCTFCLACESVCPSAGISFGFGILAGRTWQQRSRKQETRGRGQKAGTREEANQRISESTNQRISG